MSAPGYGSQLGRDDWPAQPLRIVATDVDMGLVRVFDATSGCSLAEAVSASCAAPGAWPPVEIVGACHMNGGIVSMTNADVACGARRVLVLSPFGYSDGNPVSGHLRIGVTTLRIRGGAVQVIVPDARSLEAMGENVLDPARRPASADAGFLQGMQLACGRLAHWWHGSS